MSNDTTEPARALVATALATAMASEPRMPTTETARVSSGGRKHRIQGKLKHALDYMIWEGLQWGEAADKAELTRQAMRVALERMPTRQYIKEQREVFRASISAKNFHRLAELRDQSANPMAALGAVKVLEQIESQPQAMRNERPGLVVVLSAPAHQPQQRQNVIDIQPLRSNDQ